MSFLGMQCHDCERVEVPSGDITLRRNIDTKFSNYAFTCPQCKVVVVREAPTPIAHLLTSNSVPLRDWKTPAEMLEQRRPDPMSPNEVLEILNLISRRDFGKLVQELAG